MQGITAFAALMIILMLQTPGALGAASSVSDSYSRTLYDPSYYHYNLGHVSCSATLTPGSSYDIISATITVNPSDIADDGTVIMTIAMMDYPNWKIYSYYTWNEGSNVASILEKDTRIYEVKYASQTGPCYITIKAKYMSNGGDASDIYNTIGFGASIASVRINFCTFSACHQGTISLKYTDPSGGGSGGGGGGIAAW
ncbi:hypothetical protein WKT22_04124 [Candidatus Lokiarchaeum ossiferum]